MNLQLKQLFNNAEGRYFNEIEATRLRSYGEGLLFRLDTLQAVERAEPAIIDDVCKAVMTKYPGIMKDHGPESDLRVRRDQTLVLRYAAFSMLLLDPNFIYDKVAVWLRTILFALCNVDQVIFGYRKLIEACETHLTADDAAAVIPYLRILLKEFESNRSNPA